MTEKEKKEVATIEQTALATAEAFKEFAGDGLENITASDIKIPYIQILEKLSPQVDKRSDKYIKDSEDGDIYVSGINKVFKVDKDGHTALELAFVNRVTLFTEWLPNRGGLQGHHRIEDKDTLGIIQTTNSEGKKILQLPNGNEVVETDYLFAVAIPHEEVPFFTIIPAATTRRTAIRELYTQLMFDCQGQLPTFAFLYTIGSAPKTNGQNNWNVFKFTKVTLDNGVSFVDSRGVLRIKDDKKAQEIFKACTEYSKMIKEKTPAGFLSRVAFSQEATQTVQETPETIDPKQKELL